LRGQGKLFKMTQKSTKVIEPTVAQILMCGDFSRMDQERIIEAHSKAFFILNNDERRCK